LGCSLQYVVIGRPAMACTGMTPEAHTEHLNGIRRGRGLSGGCGPTERIPGM